jgi:hypothetical protein
MRTPAPEVVENQALSSDVDGYPRMRTPACALKNLAKPLIFKRFF